MCLKKTNNVRRSASRDLGLGDLDPGDLDPGDLHPGDLDPGDLDPGDRGSRPGGPPVTMKCDNITFINCNLY